MNTLLKRMLSLMLAIFMVIGMVPVNIAHAETLDDGDGEPHEHSYEAVVTAPTCTDKGYTTYTCSCGDSYTGDETPAIDHTYGEDGKCACGAEKPVHEHSYEAVVTAPTCTDKGYTTYTCSCGDSYTGDETSVLDHTYGEDGKCGCGAVDPSYEEPVMLLVDEGTGTAMVKNAEELETALANQYEKICITEDFEIDRTYYVTYSVTIFTEAAHTITRAETFGGDMFVVGEAADGTACENTVTLTLGNPESDDSDLLIIDGNEEKVTVDVVGTVVYITPQGQADLYENLTVTNCVKVGNERALTVTDGKLSSDPKNAGGAVGIVMQDGVLNIYGGTYSNNAVTKSDTSNGYGGAFYNHSTMNVYGGVFADNAADVRAGAIYGYRKVNIYEAEFTGNTAGTDSTTGSGGAIYMPNSSGAILNIEGTKDESGYSVLFKGNASTGNGGAVSYSGPTSIFNAVFEENEAGAAGGALYGTASNSDLEIDSVELLNNTAGTNGGAIGLNATDLTANDSIFRGNEATSGAGIYMVDGSVVELYDITADGNATTTGSGGFVYNTNSTLTIYDSAISNNSAKAGSALYLSDTSSANVYNTTFDANACFESNTGNAAAVYIHPNGTATNYLFHTCTFTDNTSSGLGGAILANGKGIIELYNITATGNSALKGGFMYETTASTSVTISGLTVSGNTATEGGPIIWGNTTNAKLFINKSNYKDLDVSGELDSDYWAGAIYNKLTVSEVDTAIPSYPGQPPHEHSYEAVVTAPTCTTTGYTTYTCSCGDSYTGDETPVTDHTYDADGKCVCGDVHTHSYESVVTAPTCTDKGYTTYTCDCGHSYTGDETPIIDHVYGENGKCSCGAEHDHNYASVVTAPTCTDKGYTTYTCDGCGYSYTDNETPVLEHTYGAEGFCSCGAVDPNYVETPVELPVDEATGAAVVTSASELKQALAEKFALIRIAKDFEINRTFYVTHSVTIFTEEAHTLTRAAFFAGDVFVVGEAEDGTACENTVTLTLGNPESTGKDLLTIDGNKAKMTVDVVGTVIYVTPVGHADLYENLTVTNCVKVGNERALTVSSGLSSNPKNAGGAVGIVVQDGVLNIYGGTYSNNAVTKSDTSNGYGGAFYAHSTMNVYGGVFKDNAAAVRAGAIYGYRRLNIYKAEFTGNTAGTGSTSAAGGAIYMPSSSGAVLNIEGTKDESGYSVIFKGNATSGSGGAVSYSGPTTISNAVFQENEAGVAGGAFNGTGGYSRMKVYDTEFLDNTAGTNGGAIRVGTKNSSASIDVDLLVDGATFTGNSAGKYGSAVYVENSARAYLVRSTFTENTAVSGGAVCVTAAELGVNHTTFSDNKATSGAGIYMNEGAVVTLNDVTADGNATTTGSGGFVYNANSALTIYDSTISNNSAKAGSALFLTTGSSANVYNTTFDGNACFESNTGNAAAVYIHPDGIATNYLFHTCTFKNNTSSGYAGAILANGKGIIELYNITATGNSAAKGGFMYQTTSGTSVTISGLTVSGNTATEGGPIIWGNTTNAKLFINKSNYKDLDVSGELDSDYWAGAIYNKLTVAEIDTAIPDSPYYHQPEYDPVFTSGEVRSALQLAGALANGNNEIRILDDFEIDRTFYITRDTKIYSDSAVTLTRAADFAGDIFVVGESADGSACANKVTLTLGNPESKEKDLLTIDGNSENMTVDVKGSAIFVCCGHQADLYENVTITNCTKVGNEKTLTEAYGVSYSKTVGGAAGIVTEGAFMNIYGGSYTNNHGGSASSTSGYGGAFYNFGTMKVYGGLFEGNSANRAGAFYNYRKLYIYNAQITKNHASSSGGAIYLPASTGAFLYLGLANDVVTSSVSFAENTCDGSGGAIYNAATAKMENTVFEDNSAVKGGAICAQTSSNTNAAGVDFTGNTATEQGGAVHINAAMVSVEDCQFKDNSAVSGGAVSATGRSAEADEDGEVEFLADNADFTGNSATDGGAVYLTNEARATITNTGFQSNTATASGGAMAVTAGASVDMNCITASENTAADNGGFLYGAASAVSMYNSTVKSGAAANGAGAYLDAGASGGFYNTQFEENTATGNGGALGLHTDGGSVTVYSCSFTKNTAVNGGALDVSDKSVAELYKNTANENSADKGGFLFEGTAGTAVTISDLTVSGNTATTGGSVIWGDDAEAVLSLNKSNYTDEKVDGDIGDTYWTDAIGGTVQVQENTEEAPTYPDYGNEDPGEIGEYVDVSSADELAAALAGGKPIIRIVDDFQLDRTFYITADTTIFSTSRRTLTRAADFGSDIFVVGEKADGTLCAQQVTLTLGNPNSSTRNLLKIDGNKDNMTVPVSGTVIFVCGGANAKLYENLTVINSVKTANEKTNTGAYGVSYPDTVGGAVAILSKNAAMSIYGGNYSDNGSNTSGTVSCYGGAFYNFGVMDVYGGTFNDNYALRGGAFYNYRTLHIYKATISGNSAAVGGMVYVPASTSAFLYLGGENEVVESAVTISENTSSGNGGAIYNGATTTVMDTTFLKNTSKDKGGAIYNVSSSNLTVAKSVFDDNSASEYGGALYLIAGMATLENTEFKNNDAEYGGAVYVKSQSSEAETYELQAVNATFSGNTAKEDGGALYLTDNARTYFKDSAFTDNSAMRNGGAAYAGTCSVVTENTAFSGNTATEDGGAVYATGSGVTADATSFSGNSAAKNGGALALYAASTAILQDCTANGNEAVAEGGFAYVNGSKLNMYDGAVSGSAAANGGAINFADAGEGYICNTAFEGNSATGNGGAVAIGANSKAFMHSCSATNNTATGLGGGIYVSDNGVLELYNATATGNSANSGGVLVLDSANAKATVNGLTISGNSAVTAGPVIYGTASGAALTTNKANWTDSELTGEADDAYWATVIAGELTVTETDAKIPGYAENGNEDAGELWNPTNVTSAEELEAALKNGDDAIRISADFAFDRTFTISANTTIFTTKAHTLTRASDFTGALFQVNTGVALTLGNPISQTADLLTISGGSISTATSLILLQEGAQVDVYDNLTVKDCVSTANGAVFSVPANATVHVLGGNFAGNSAENGGVVYAAGGTVELGKAAFTQNKATAMGGAVYLSGKAKVSVNATTFQSNTAVSGGAAAAENGAVLNITEGLLNANTAENGGAVYVNGASVQLDGGTFSKNTAKSNGGAVYLTNVVSATITAAEFTGNVGKTSGGALYTNSAAVVTDAVFTKNQAPSGGAVYTTGANLELTKCTFTENTATRDGGVVALYKDASVTITDATATGNHAGNTGGVAYVNAANLKVQGGTFSGNTATRDGGALAIFKNGNADVSAAVFSENTASVNGGAVYISSAKALVQECTFSKNEAVNNGGAFYLTGTADLKLHKTEAEANAAATGGVAYLTGLATATVTEFTPTDNTASVAGPVFYGTSNAVLNVDTTYAAEGAMKVNKITKDPSQPKPGEEIVDSKWKITKVSSAKELQQALAAKAPYIQITADFKLDRTFYITDTVTIFSTEAHTLTRAANFAGDIFVVGEHSDGTSALLNGHNAKLTLGNPLSTTENLLIIDGNRDKLTVEVSGTVLFISEGATVDLYHNTTICNNLKMGNSRILDERYGNTHAPRVGGAMAIAISGVLNVYGGNYRDNAVNVENATTNPDGISTYGGAIYNRATVYIYGGNFYKNEGARGGVMYNYNMAKIYDGKFVENHATKHGGVYYAPSSAGVHVLIGSETVDSTPILFENNTAYSTGGAFYNGVLSGMNIYGNTIFSGNKALHANAGAIYSSGQLMANNVRFINNSSASGYGGALHLSNGTDSQVTRFVELNGCIFSGNSAKYGGAISQLRSSSNTKNGAKVFMTDCEFVGNFGSTGGTLYADAGATLNATNCNFYDNTATGEAGVAYVIGLAKATFTGCNFTNNNATSHGGAISVRSATLTIDGTTVNGNVSGSNGGAIYISYSSRIDKNSVVNITGASFSDNSGKSGGVIYATERAITKDHPVLDVADTTFADNKASSAGGAIRLTGGVDVYMRDVEFLNNKATTSDSMGGAISAGKSTLEIDGATFTGNTSKDLGGAISMESSAAVTLNDIKATKNSSGQGGFLYSTESTLNIYSSNISENSASSGGGMYLYYGAVSNIRSTSFKKNTASSGAGLFLYTNGANVLMHSCTLQENAGTGTGGGMYISGETKAQLYNTTATGNTANLGGFLYETKAGTQVLIAGLTVSGNKSAEGGDIIWGNTFNAVLNLNKSLYTDLDHTGELDDAYWAAAIVNKLTVNNVTDKIPANVEYVPRKTAGKEEPKKNPAVPVSDVLNLAKKSSDADINSTYNKLPKLDNSSNFMSRGTTYFDNINGGTVSVDTYVYQAKKAEGNMQVGLGLMIYQAMLYKQAHPEEDVYIDATSYRFSVQTAVNINRNSRYFGYVRDLKTSDYDEYGFVRIAYLLVSAAKMGIHVTVIGQLDAYPVSSSAMRFEEYFNYHLNDPCDKKYAKGYVSDYMNFQFCDWTLEGKGGTDMMHNKMMAVSDYLDMNGVEHHDAVWSSSTNYDGVRSDAANGNWKQQTATIVSDHADIYRVSRNYIQLIARNCEQEDVIEWHDMMNTMNVQQIDLIRAGRGNEIPADEQIVYLGTKNDDVFELYFTPFGGGTSSWNEIYNPYCKFVRELYESDDYIEFSWNAAEYHEFKIGNQIEELVSTAMHRNRNVKNKIYVNAESFDGSVYDDLVVGKDIGFKRFNEYDFGKVHNKDILMSYVKDGQRYFVSLMNSMNGHSGAMYYQANFMLVIKETSCADDSVYKTVAKYSIMGDFGEHTYGAVKDYLPDGKDGYSYHECKFCGHKETIGVLHHEGNWIVDKAATAAENGLRHTECTICGTIVRTEEFAYAPELHVNMKEMKGLTFNSGFVLPIGNLSSAPHTLEATIQVPSDLSGRGGVIVSNYTGGSGNQLSLEVYTGGRIRLYAKSGSSKIDCIFSTDIRSDAPVHIAVSVKDTKATLYVDGVSVETKTLSGKLPAAVSGYYVGGDKRSGNSQYFKGVIYSVNLFADTRTSKEIKQDCKLVASNSGSLLYSRYFEDKAEFTSGSGKTFTKSTKNKLPTLTGVPHTFEAVVQLPTSISDRGGVIVSNYDGSSAPQICLEIYTNGRPRLFVKNGKTESDCLFSTDIRSSSAKHIAITVDGTKATLYVNGAAVETKTLKAALPEAVENYMIGGDNRSGNKQYFKGTIYSVNLYNDVRTAAEIKQDALVVNTSGDSMLYSNVYGTSTRYTHVNRTGKTFTAKELNRIGKLTGSPNTMEALIQVPKSMSGRGGVIVSNYDGGSGRQISLEVYTNGRIRLFTKSGSKENDCIFSTDIRSSSPVHVAVVVNGKSATLYVNGTAEETRYLTYDLPNAVDKFAIGGDYRSGNKQYFKGTIYSVDLFNDSRSSAEIKRDMVKAAGDNLMYSVICSNYGILTPDAMTFSANESISVGNLESNPNTMEAIVQVPKSLSGRGGVIVSNYDGGTGRQISLEVYTKGRIRLFTKSGSKENDCVFSTDIRSDSPVHIAVSVSRTKATLYVNGTAVETKTLSYNLPKAVNNFVIGGDNRKGNTRYFKGTIYSVALFDDPRTAAQIKEDSRWVNLNSDLVYSGYLAENLTAADSSACANHAAGSVAVDRAQTDKLNGIYRITCSACGQIFSYQEIGKAGDMSINYDRIGALSFDSNKELGYAVGTLSKTPFTYETVIQLDSGYADRGGVLISNYDGGDQDQFSLEVYEKGAPRLYFKKGGTAYNCQFSTDVRSKNRVHLTVTIEGTTAKLYMDGELKETKTLKTTMPSVTKDITIGGDGRSKNAQYFKGSIYSVAMFSDARTAKEVAVDAIRIPSNASGLIYEKVFD